MNELHKILTDLFSKIKETQEKQHLNDICLELFKHVLNKGFPPT